MGNNIPVIRFEQAFSKFATDDNKQARKQSLPRRLSGLGLNRGREVYPEQSLTVH
jgi:hypothetical protein